MDASAGAPAPPPALSGSFVLRCGVHRNLAIRRKLILEVVAEPSAKIIPAVAEEPADCLIGETMRELYADPYGPRQRKRD